MKVENFKRFSLKMLRCEARAFHVGTAEEGGRDYVIATTNRHSKIKKYGYKVNKRLFGQSSDGRNGPARCSTKLNMPGS